MCKTKECVDCGCVMKNVANATKRCKDCLPFFTKLNDRNRSKDRYLSKIEGAKTDVVFVRCILCGKSVCKKKTKKSSKLVQFCGKDCTDKFFKGGKKESVRWKENPFTFKASDVLVARKKRWDTKPIAKACDFCGSVKLLGEANARALNKSGRSFCDEDCAANWRSVHYASPNHKPMEELRQKTKARKHAERLLVEARKAERLAKRLTRPANKKTPGYATCCVCNKSWWVEQHATHIKYCSVSCRRKHPSNKKKRKELRRNREHVKRSRGIGDRITIAVLMRKHRSRCANCNTKCVTPEGYNHQNEGTIDHIMPLSKGGLHIWSNVQLLCRQCNTAKSDTVKPGTQLMLDLRFGQ